MYDNSLITDDFKIAEEPFAIFDQWFLEAEQHETDVANAMSLATIDSMMMPDVRIVLLKEVTSAGFVFYTNEESQKGQQLLFCMNAALCFHWKVLHRQVRIRGIVEKLSEQESDLYYASRPKESQIGAWASQQSRPLESRAVFEQALAHYEAVYASSSVPRPFYWRGFRLCPLAIEFWQERAFRLHDRVLFTRESIEQTEWQKTFLYP